jgi:hypothetical protein
MRAFIVVAISVAAYSAIYAVESLAQIKGTRLVPTQGVTATITALGLISYSRYNLMLMELWIKRSLGSFVIERCIYTPLAICTPFLFADYFTSLLKSWAVLGMLFVVWVVTFDNGNVLALRLFRMESVADRDHRRMTVGIHSRFSFVNWPPTKRSDFLLFDFFFLLTICFAAWFIAYLN